MKSYVWKNPTGVTRLAVGCLIFVGLTHFVSLAVWLMFQGRAAYLPDQTDFTFAQQMKALVDLAIFAGYLVGLLLAFWIVRACKNAHALSKKMTITPFFAVVWYVVPFACWYKPYESMKEIWVSSSGLPEKDIPPILRNWWILFIVSTFAGGVNARFLDNNWIIGIFANLLSLACVYFLISIVRQICSMQITRNEMKSVFGEPQSIWDAGPGAIRGQG